MLTTIFVTDGGDAGPGTFRQAIIDANTDATIDAIIFNEVDAVEIDSTVQFTGAQALSIDGKVATIKGEDIDLFVSSGGADLSLSNLTFQDGVNGILVQVPAEAEGVLCVALKNVVAENNDRFGVKIGDKDDGAPAGIRLDVSHSSFTGNGKDGLRVEDSGDGGIVAKVVDSQFGGTLDEIDDNGVPSYQGGNRGDGLQLDETGPGSVELEVVNSTFNGNGLPDKDDGLDIDEADDGSLWVRLVNATFNGNGDEGVDLDEAGQGDVDIAMVHVEAIGNQDGDGIKLDEEDGGDLTVELRNIVLKLNDGDGIQAEETGEGDFFMRVANATITRNGKYGIKVEHEGVDDDTGLLILQNVFFEDNDNGDYDLNDVDVIER
jgi:hypothetical protein